MPSQLLKPESRESPLFPTGQMGGVGLRVFRAPALDRTANAEEGGIPDCDDHGRGPGQSIAQKTAWNQLLMN